MNTGLMTVGVPDPGNDPFLQWVRNELLKLHEALVPPAPVTNFRVTALAGQVQVDFTRSDADNYILYWNERAATDGATRIELGSANKYVDDIGKGGVQRYYAVKPKRGNVEGPVSLWLAQTSLPLATPVTPPLPPPASTIACKDVENDAVAVVTTDKGSVYPV